MYAKKTRGKREGKKPGLCNDIRFCYLVYIHVTTSEIENGAEKVTETMVASWCGCVSGVVRERLKGVGPCG